MTGAKHLPEATFSNTFLKFAFPADDVAAIVQQATASAEARFRNVSLAGQESQVVVEARGPERTKPLTDLPAAKLSAELPNGQKVALFALGRLAGDKVEWWAPDGSPAEIPWALPCDVDGHTAVAIMRVENGAGWVPFLARGSSLKFIETTYLGPGPLTIVPLDDLQAGDQATLVVCGEALREEPKVTDPRTPMRKPDPSTHVLGQAKFTGLALAPGQHTTPKVEVKAVTGQVDVPASWKDRGPAPVVPAAPGAPGAPAPAR